MKGRIPFKLAQIKVITIAKIKKCKGCVKLGTLPLGIHLLLHNTRQQLIPNGLIN